MNLLWHEPGRMAYERFHAVYVQCFCGSICIYIYIWARFMVLYLIHYFSGGPEKHARPYIYILYVYKSSSKVTMFHPERVPPSPAHRGTAFCALPTSRLLLEHQPCPVGHRQTLDLAESPCGLDYRAKRPVVNGAHHVDCLYRFVRRSCSFWLCIVAVIFCV